jgi:hypothetical protein
MTLVLFVGDLILQFISLCSFHLPPFISTYFGSNTVLSNLFLNTLNLCSDRELTKNYETITELYSENSINAVEAYAEQNIQTTNKPPAERSVTSSAACQGVTWNINERSIALLGVYYYGPYESQSFI